MKNNSYYSFKKILTYKKSLSNSENEINIGISDIPEKVKRTTFNMTISYAEMYYKNNIYKLLINPNVSIHYKLTYIDRNNILEETPMKVDLKKGGLYKDWDIVL
jgi:hypothetical protein